MEQRRNLKAKRELGFARMCGRRTMMEGDVYHTMKYTHTWLCTTTRRFIVLVTSHWPTIRECGLVPAIVTGWAVPLELVYCPFQNDSD